MSKQIYHIESYALRDSDALLFDANIWLYIYGSTAKSIPYLRTTYTTAFRRIRSVKIPIFLDVVVLSEFINSYARLIYNRLPPATKPIDFKNFRDSSDFKPVAGEIATKAQRIVEKCERTESGFEAVNLTAILNDYSAGESDFNDQMLAELCKAKGMKLVTHDADFSGSNLTLLTANPRLLSLNFHPVGQLARIKV